MDIENLYLDFSPKEKQKFRCVLSCNNFELEFLFFDSPTLASWIAHFKVFCVQKNILEKYQLTKKLDKGGFATVYLSQNIDSGEIFAVKMIEKNKIITHRNYVSLGVTQPDVIYF